MTPAASSGDVRPVWSPGQEWRVSEVPILTIGQLDGPEAIGFLGQLGEYTYVGHDPEAASVAVLEDGRIALADGGTNDVRVYDRTGVRTASMARSGVGPGEFRSLSGVEGFGGGDSLLVWESGRSVSGWEIRIAVYTTGGELLRVASLRESEHPMVLGVLEDGSFVGASRLFDPLNQPGGLSRVGVARDPVTYRVYTPSAELGQLLGPFPGTERHHFGDGFAQDAYSGRTTIAAVGRRRVYTGYNDRFAIRAWDPASGNVIVTYERPHPPIPVPYETLAAQRQRTQGTLDSRGRGGSVRDVPAYDTYPSFARIVEDDDENIWVRHYDDGRTWSVFDRTGSWLGEVEISLGNVLWIGSDEMLLSARDEFRVSYVHLHPIIK